jgi:hypothetical protein
MSTVNAINPRVDLTARIFDDFDNVVLEVDANEYDVVNSYFESIFSNKEDAANLTNTFFRISQETGVSVQILLNQVAGQTSMQVTSTMAYYLNGLRSPSTLLGVSNPVTPNYYTARNVLP